jgi:hypothetical protein
MSDTVIGPAADPRARKAVRDTMEQRNRQHESDERFIFSSPQGQRFVATFIDECGLYAPVPDAGKRAIAVGLRERIIKCDPKFWQAVEAAILARRIAPTNKPIPESEEIEDE